MPSPRIPRHISDFPTVTAARSQARMFAQLARECRQRAPTAGPRELYELDNARMYGRYSAACHHVARMIQDRTENEAAFFACHPAD